ncbi:MAG: dockerin type I repeat-containing protein [Phycisphaeraceae bacterium]|nr:dockerin type I repeat-containing protein [Phycisphaeraceae bacterium]
MNSRGLLFFAATAIVAAFASAQLQMPSNPRALPLSRLAASSPSNAAMAGTQQSRILWIRNDKTGQVVTPGVAAGRKVAEDTAPRDIYNNYDNPGGLVGLNLNWNYKEAYTDPDFSAPDEGPRIQFLAFNISSDPQDPDDFYQTIGGEKLSLLFEPYHATNWPDQDLNVRFPIAQYGSVVASYSEQFEIRICRIYFFSLSDVGQAFDPVTNPYVLELQLSFAFVSFPFFGVESPFLFDLTGFEPPLEIKGDGLILTHWMKLSEPPPCPGDLNLDGLVEDQDFVLFLAQYNILDCADETMPEFCSADLNFDGFVDDADFVIFLSGYNDLLCPPAFVIRKAYAPVAGGRFRWDTPDNMPPADPLEAPAIPNPTGWPFPSTLVTVPHLSAPYPDPFDVGCSFFGCQPSFVSYFSTLTGFHNVNELNMEADDLKLEYERFLNEIAVDTSPSGRMRSYAFFDLDSFLAGGFPNTDWVPSSTAKRLSITAPVPTATK